MNNQELAKMAIDKLWPLLKDPRLKGCSPYEAARKIGIGSETAKLVEKLWDGPARFPGP